MIDNELVGSVRREPRMPRRDRKAAVQYRCSPRERYRREASSGQSRLTCTENELLHRGYFIAEINWDNKTALALPPHARPMLVRTAALALAPLPGGVIVDAFGDYPALAVLGLFLQPAPSELLYGAKLVPVTAEVVAYWIGRVGRTAVERELDNFRYAVGQYAAAMSPENGPRSFFSHLGSGPLRDVDLAKAEYQRLIGSCSIAQIRDHLNLTGHLNPKGSVGRWSDEQVRSLGATRRG